MRVEVRTGPVTLFTSLAQVTSSTTLPLFRFRELLRGSGRRSLGSLLFSREPCHSMSIFRSFIESASSSFAKLVSRGLDSCSDGERLRFRYLGGASSSDSARDSEQVSALSSSRARVANEIVMMSCLAFAESLPHSEGRRKSEILRSNEPSHARPSPSRNGTASMIGIQKPMLPSSCSSTPGRHSDIVAAFSQLPPVCFGE